MHASCEHAQNGRCNDHVRQVQTNDDTDHVKVTSHYNTIVLVRSEEEYVLFHYSFHHRSYVTFRILFSNYAGNTFNVILELSLVF